MAFFLVILINVNVGLIRCGVIVVVVAILQLKVTSCVQRGV